jgi:hypothetical protein
MVPDIRPWFQETHPNHSKEACIYERVVGFFGIVVNYRWSDVYHALYFTYFYYVDINLQNTYHIESNHKL